MLRHQKMLSVSSQVLRMGAMVTQHEQYTSQIWPLSGHSSHAMSNATERERKNEIKFTMGQFAAKSAYLNSHTP